MQRLLLGAALLALATAADATVIIAGVTAIDARTLVVSSSVPDWLEIAEVEAFTFGDANVAAAANGGAAVSTSDYGGGTPASKAIDGLRPGGYPDEWHSGGSDAAQKLTVSFAAAHDLKLVSIWGGGGMRGYNGRDQFHLVVLNEAGGELWRGALDASQLGGRPISVEFLRQKVDAIPEPTTWAMLIAGFGMVGSAVRRRRGVLA